MTVIDIPGDLALLDAAIESVPNQPAVFVLWPREGSPHISKTSLLRRRLLRLMREREKPSRLLNLRHSLRRIEYQLTGSAFESGVTLLEEARRLFPEDYLDIVRLRMPPYLRIVLSNEFPRTHVTTQLKHSGGLYFGPFRSRAAAERFEGGFLDLFQVRRCHEELAPSPTHPGCIYGEMGMCLRPCQQVVGAAEYRNEVERAAEFLRSGGRSMLDAIERSRDRLCEEMQFEEAARQHKRIESIQEVLKLRDELAGDVDRLNGVAITRSLAPEAVELWLVREGNWLGPQRLSFEVRDGKPVPLDRASREVFAAAEPRRHTVRERQEYLALLSRWYYSSWRDGEWLSFDAYQDIPYRKLVNAVSRVARRTP
jgi:excinuclease UvrABC nuclease subunit